MTLTPLEEIEVSIHEEFGDQKPTEEEAGAYIRQRYPTMDGGLVLAAALAALALQGWQVYRDEQDRRRQRMGNGGPPKKCPICGSEKQKDIEGKSVCINKHTW